jgi:hypothetical protein
VPRRPVLLVGALALLAVAMVVLAQVTGGNGGGAHPLGTEVEVGYHEVESDGTTRTRTRLELTVLRVRAGTQEELEANGIELDPEDRTATPYYVDARWANGGSKAIERIPSVNLDDDDGNTFSRLLVFGAGDEPFAPCPEAAGLEPGASVESCSLVLVPDGIEIVRVSYLSDSGPDAEPELVYWETE